MPAYEHVFLARQDLAQGQVDALSEAFSRIISDGKGRVAKTEYWGLRSLAYRIRKNRKAHYTMLTIDAPAPAIAELERQVGLNEDILRFMTVRVEQIDAEPSAMMRRAERSDRDRDERGGGRDRDDRPRGDRPDRGDRPRGGAGDRPGGFRPRAA